MLNLISYFLKKKYSFKSPLKKKIVVYGHGSEQLKFLNKNDFITYYINGEEINFFLIFKTLLNFGFLNFKENYRQCFFETVNPKFVITYRCDLKAFYELKKKLINTKTILIQWGKTMESYLRHFNKNKNFFFKYEVDHMYLFGSSTEKIFSNNIKGKTFSVGSIANNRFNFKEKIKKNTLIFISQAKTNRIFPQIEKLIIQVLAKFCKKKNLQFSISTRVLATDIKGKNFYRQIVGNECGDWKYFPRKNVEVEGDYQAYKHVMLSEFVVFIDSTLGFEALSRKKKVVALPLGSFNPSWCKINYRVNSKNDNYYVPTKFGFPKKFKKEGKFWLSDFDEKKIEEKLNFITSVSEISWKKLLKSIKIDEIIKFDLHNKTLITNLNNLRMPLNKTILKKL